MEKQIFTNEEIKDPKLEFYRLHYPVKKKPVTPSKAQKIRSKSMISVLNTLDNEENFQIEERMKNNKKLQFSPQKQKILKKFKEVNSLQSKVTFKKILSCQNDPSKLSENIHKLPIKSLKDLEEFSHNNITLRNSLQRAKQQKLKVNKLILSHKQPQQIKLDYLQSKRKDVVDQIDKEIRSIYQKYFKKEYQTKYGVRAFFQFQKSIGGVIGKLSEMIFL